MPYVAAEAAVKLPFASSINCKALGHPLFQCLATQISAHGMLLVLVAVVGVLTFAILFSELARLLSYQLTELLSTPPLPGPTLWNIVDTNVGSSRLMGARLITFAVFLSLKIEIMRTVTVNPMGFDNLPFLFFPFLFFLFDGSCFPPLSILPYGKI